ncbi:uncharacterized protein TRAVEDRAFT_136630 [Trametes versicolor FP-101664 SS1]|uniref:Elongin-A n=1 Tax=Trametes versicolor (strain FP-101664) TaxID=717944 RepID=R7S7T8_TRAVS|nr:uncharacterized protein TRAVEDRAFT_136630 [Trametes versicolor FP-101664 SS1]EIW51750.1 hypothetical protein TRAVEDRAFT_136630 [Trametes versicolor FP-101664 SS1]
MSYDTEHGGRAVPTLVQCCQRGFTRLGEGLRKDLILPVLNSCTAETLWQLEEEDPVRLPTPSRYIWKRLCCKQYPLLVRDTDEDEPECGSWKEEFARCQEEDANKLEKAAARLREKRQLDEEQRKASSIKITDRLPPAAKRARWGASAPKTLFQKTRTHAANMQKGVFSALMTRPAFQQRTLVSHAVSARPPPPLTSTSAASGSRVTVRAVAVPRNPPKVNRAPSAPSKVAGPSKPALAVSRSMDVDPSTPVASATSPPEVPSSPPDGRSPPPRPVGKKNPASVLFMPKNRAYSQLPARGVRSKS